STARVGLRPRDASPADRATPALDVFGLGAVLYEALAFVPPDARRPVRARRLNPTIPEGVEAVLMKAVDPEPRWRYARTSELAAELETLLAGGVPARSV